MDIQPHTLLGAGLREPPRELQRNGRELQREGWELSSGREGLPPYLLCCNSLLTRCLYAAGTDPVLTRLYDIRYTQCLGSRRRLAARIPLSRWIRCVWRLTGVSISVLCPHPYIHQPIIAHHSLIAASSFSRSSYH